MTLLDQALSLLPSDDCVPWPGRTGTTGYGRGSLNGRRMGAHRLVWIVTVGPIETGLEIDHLCRNRACVNPLHLEPVTGRENKLRGMGWSGRNARKGQCPEGHPYSEDNTYISPKGGRFCMTCRRDTWRLTNEKRRVRERGEDGRVVSCVNGHRYTKENTYTSPDGRKVCKECRKVWKRRSRDAEAVS